MPQGWTPTRIGNICKTNQRTYSVAEKWPFVNYLDTGNITENRVGDIHRITSYNVCYTKLLRVPPLMDFASHTLA